MTEQWLSVPGYEGFYEVSDLGRVRSVDRVKTSSNQSGEYSYLRSGRVMRTKTGSAGYPTVCLYREGRKTYFSVHRLVLLTFWGECPPGSQACHNNGIKTDNRLENLRWDTDPANKQDIKIHGNNYNLNITHCPQGHEYTDENTYRPPSGGRICRVCKRAKTKQWKNNNAEYMKVYQRSRRRKERQDV